MTSSKNRLIAAFALLLAACFIASAACYDPEYKNDTENPVLASSVSPTSLSFGSDGSAAVSVSGSVVLVNITGLSRSYVYDWSFNWGDGTSYTVEDRENTCKEDHNYTSDGTYTITISGEAKEAPGGATLHTISSKTVRVTIDSYNPPVYYTVSFNANGGSTTPSSQTVKSGDSLKLPANAGTKSGYSFGGWTTGNSTVAGGTTIIVRQDLHYTAVWNKQTTYCTVEFYEGDMSTLYWTASVEKGTSLGSSMPPDPTMSGYSFLKWITGGGQTFTSSTTVNQDLSIYPDFTPGKYTAVLDTNGGGTSTAKTVTFGETYGTLPTPSRDGYTFAGWFTEKVGGTQITASTTVTTPGHHIIYAHWNAVTHTVSFNSNGGSGSISGITGSAESPVSLPSSGFTKTNYVLKGWNTSADGSGTHYDLGSSFTPVADITLYAEWKSSNLTVSYKVIFGETIKEGSLTAESSTVLVKSLLESSDNIAWLKIFNAEYGYYLDQNKTKPMSDNLTVSEISSTDVIYVIVTTYVYNLYDGDTLVKTWNEYWTESSIYMILVREVEAREGYTLHFRDSAGNTYHDDGDMPTIKHDENFYTVWTPIQYTVTFDSNGGSSVAAQTVNHNSIPAKPEDPTKSGYVFGGWYKNSELTSEYTFTAGITSDQTLFAKWYEDIVFDSVPSINDIIVSINGKTVTLSLEADNYRSIKWNLGDGSETITTYQPSLIYTYETPGTYEITATAVNSIGGSEPIIYDVEIKDTEKNEQNNEQNNIWMIVIVIIAVIAVICILRWLLD